MLISTSMRRLEVFLAVAETGRFSLAADRLGIAQPSVSAHISGLERQIGKSLFLRNPGRPPALRRAGKSMLTYALDVLRKSHETAAALINESRADIGLFLGLQRMNGLPSEVVGYQKLAIVVSPGHKLATRDEVSPEELQEFPFIGGLPNSRFARLIETVLRKLGVRDPQYALRLQDATALTAVARRGVGVHCKPLCNVEADLRAGLLKQVPVTVAPMSLQIRLAFRSFDQISGAAHRFAEFLRTSNAWTNA